MSLQSLSRELRKYTSTSKVPTMMRVPSECIRVEFNYQGKDKIKTVGVSFCSRDIRDQGTTSFRLVDAFSNKGTQVVDISNKDDNFIDNLVSKEDAVGIWESLLPRIREELILNFPYYDNLLESCIWEQTDNDSPVNTLAVGWDKFTSSFTLYYNPSFILKGALFQYMIYPKDFKTLEECYIYMAKYYLMHEMSHITRMHLERNVKALEGVDPQMVNILGDSFINQNLTTMLKGKSHPVIGISTEISNYGKLKRESDTFVTGCLVELCRSLFKADSVNATGINRSKLVGGKDCIVRITQFMPPSEMGITNSSDYIKSINDFFKNLFSEGSDNLSDGDSGDSSGGSGSGDSGNGSSDGNSKGDSDNSGDSGESKTLEDLAKEIKKSNSNVMGDKNKSEEEANTDVPDSNSPNEKINKKVKDIVEKAINDSIKQDSDKSSGSSSSASSDDSETNSNVMSNISSQVGADINTMGLTTLRTNTKCIWKKKLSNLIKNALGIREIYDSSVPSARIEGQLGREIEVPKISSILLLIDCSCSMGPQKFLSALNEVQAMSKSTKELKKCVVHVVYWGSEDSQIYRKFKLDSNLVKNIKSAAKSLGSTYLGPAIAYSTKKVKKPDVTMVFTDGEIGDSPTRFPKEATTFITRNKKRLIWVLTPDGTDKWIKQFDSTCSSRVIKPKSIK